MDKAEQSIASSYSRKETWNQYLVKETAAYRTVAFSVFPVLEVCPFIRSLLSKVLCLLQSKDKEAEYVNHRF